MLLITDYHCQWVSVMIIIISHTERVLIVYQEVGSMIKGANINIIMTSLVYCW